MSEDLLRRGAQRLTLRHAALRLGLQTAISVAVVVVALVLVALAVVLRSQHAAAINEITHSVRTADDVTDPPSGAWLVIRTPTKFLTSKGLPAGFPDAAALEAGVESTTNVEVRGTEYLVYTQPRAGGVVEVGVGEPAPELQAFTPTATISISANVRRRPSPRRNASARHGRYQCDLIFITVSVATCISGK